MPDTQLPEFTVQYAPLVKDVFRELVARDSEQGLDMTERSHHYAARGKPEFVLAYLMVANLTDSERRDILAAAFEQHAAIAEAKAQQWDAEHHRPFPLIALEASKDRTMARQVRQGKMIRMHARAAKPLAVQ